MQIRGLLIAVVACALLGGGVWWASKHPESDDKKADKDAPPKIVSIANDQITTVDLKRRDGSSTVLKRIGSNKWEISAPKQLGADTEAVNSLIANFTVLTADRLVDEKPADLASYGLSTPALEALVSLKDGKTQKLLIGDDTPTGSSCFVMLAGDPKVYTISTSIKASIDKTSADLRDKRILTFDSEKLTRVELTAKKATFEFGKNNQNEWTIVKPKPLRADGWQVEELVRKLKEAKMDTSISEEDAKKAAGAFDGGTVIATAKISDASGTQTVEVRKVKDDYYAKSSAVDGVHKVAADLGTGLDKSLEDFRNKKLFDFGFSEPTKIEIKKAGAAAVVYQKTGEKWFNGPKAIDSTSLQNFVDKARDLSATKFSEGAPGAAVFEVTITSNDGKRTEKVAVSKSGDAYAGTREGEPAIYQLDTKAADDLMKAAADIKEAPPEKKK